MPETQPDLRGVSTPALKAAARSLKAELRSLFSSASWNRLSDADQDRALDQGDAINDDIAAIGAELDAREEAGERAAVEYEQHLAATAKPMFRDGDGRDYSHMIGGKALYPSPRPLDPGLFQAHSAMQAPAPLAYGTGARVSNFADEPGIGVARVIKSWLAGERNLEAASRFAATAYGDDTRVAQVFRAALLQGVGTAGGFLVPDQQSREVVELLRNLSVIRPYARVVPVSGSMTLPVVAGGVTASWLGEGTDDLAQDITFGQLRFVPHKLRALVPISNDLIRNSSPEADTIVRDDLARGLSEAEDQAFLRGSGVGDVPRGIRNWVSTANTFASAGTTAANIETDLIKMATALTTGMKSQIGAPRWLMSHRSFWALYNLKRTTTDLLVFNEIREDPPRLLGWPVSVTGQIPTTLSPGTNSEVVLADMREILVGQELGLQIAVSDSAAYKDSGGTLQSAFSLDMTVLRAILKSDIVTRRPEAVTVLTGVGW